MQRECAVGEQIDVWSEVQKGLPSWPPAPFCVLRSLVLTISACRWAAVSTIGPPLTSRSRVLDRKTHLPTTLLERGPADSPFLSWLAQAVPSQ